eukprot:CAMPEP_0179141554 /NCGR_PEP_ID=MMETSP0796-20121207/67905_1 /TAXON_ID=73915 /ORGANISM="Pyrodinium bahamense, Strain pbaha01" /LENGTH=55 /DNA_ID=CAMNT_0020841299 /DNA_START=52 /DNA_END=216 /DNA_ORIENTATION=+
MVAVLVVSTTTVAPGTGRWDFLVATAVHAGPMPQEAALENYYRSKCGDDRDDDGG